MLEKPDLSDEKIINCLRASYGIPAAGVEFLPVGNDATAWVYRVDCADRKTYFLKVKRGVIYEPGVAVPRYLKDRGIEQVVAPLPTLANELWQPIDPFSLILYPFIAGRDAMSSGMSERQWVEFGATLKIIHATPISTELSAILLKETFNLHPRWIRIIDQLQAGIPVTDYADPYEKPLAEFWKSRSAEIAKIVERTAALGRALQTRHLDFVLCHSDIHTANLLLDPNGSLFIVDWDQPVFAPKERDLMFVIDSLDAIEGRSADEQYFFRGYGQTNVDWLALAYYRYEWVVQEIGDYGARMYFMDDIGEETKKDSLRGFRQLFDPGDVVDSAYKVDAKLPPEFRS